MFFFFCLPCLTLIFYFTILGIIFPSKRKFIKSAIKCFWTKARGKYCSDAFDELIHKRFVMWLSGTKLKFLAKFFVNKRNFDIALVLSLFIFTAINVALFILLMNWIFVQSPCAGKEVCSL